MVNVKWRNEKWCDINMLWARDKEKRVSLAKDWNKLRNELRADGLSLGSFKRKTFKYLQEQDKTQHKLNVYCSLIPFIFFYTFFIVIISLSAILLKYVRCTIVFF